MSRQLSITLALALILLSGTVAVAAPDCRQVSGKLAGTITSPAPLMTSGSVSGAVAGAYDRVVVNTMPADVSAAPLFTAQSCMHTRNGDLNFAESGSFDYATGNVVALWTAASGTGTWTGAYGQIVATGKINVTAGTEEIRFSGEICRP